MSLFLRFAKFFPWFFEKIKHIVLFCDCSTSFPSLQKLNLINLIISYLFLISSKNEAFSLCNLHNFSLVFSTLVT